MGWNVQNYRDDLLVAHAGALNGFRTHIVLLPNRNTGFALFVNAGRGWSLYAMRNTLIDMLTNHPTKYWNAYYLKLDRDAEARAAKAKAERLAKRAANTTPTRALADYTGIYTNEAYGPVNVSLVDGGLMLQWNRITAPLTHYHYDVFDAAEEQHALEETVTFNLDNEKKVKSLTIFGQTFLRPPTPRSSQ
jgi:hypothetical protein